MARKRVRGAKLIAAPSPHKPEAPKGLLAYYRWSVEHRPLVTNMFMLGTLCSLGDCAAQFAERHMDVSSSGGAYNWARTFRMLIWGSCIAGPVFMVWYRFLHIAAEAVRAEGHSGRVIGFGKVMADCVIFQSTWLNVFFFVMSLMEGHSVSEAVTKMQTSFFHAWKLELIVWTPVQAINLNYVSPSVQPTVVAAVNVGWQATLSILNHVREAPARKASAAKASAAKASATKASAAKASAAKASAAKARPAHGALHGPPPTPSEAASAAASATQASDLQCVVHLNLHGCSHDWLACTRCFEPGAEAAAKLLQDGCVSRRASLCEQMTLSPAGAAASPSSIAAAGGGAGRATVGTAVLLGLSLGLVGHAFLKWWRGRRGAPSTHRYAKAASPHAGSALGSGLGSEGCHQPNQVTHEFLPAQEAASELSSAARYDPHLSSRLSPLKERQAAAAEEEEEEDDDDGQCDGVDEERAERLRERAAREPDAIPDATTVVLAEEPPGPAATVVATVRELRERLARVVSGSAADPSGRPAGAAGAAGGEDGREGAAPPSTTGWTDVGRKYTPVV